MARSQRGHHPRQCTAKSRESLYSIIWYGLVSCWMLTADDRVVWCAPATVQVSVDSKTWGRFAFLLSLLFVSCFSGKVFECHKNSIFPPYASSCTLPPSGSDNWNLLKTLISPWNKGWKLKLNTRFTLAWLSQLSEPKLSTSAQWMSYACVRRHLSTSFFFNPLFLSIAECPGCNYTCQRMRNVKLIDEFVPG